MPIRCAAKLRLKIIQGYRISYRIIDMLDELLNLVKWVEKDNYKYG